MFTGPNFLTANALFVLESRIKQFNFPDEYTTKHVFVLTFVARKCASNEPKV